MKIKKGDNVIVIAGKDKGKSGKVTRVFPDKNQVVIEGINVKKRHQKARKERQKGQILEIAAPVNASNVLIADPKTGKPTRTGWKTEGKKKTRISKRSGVAV